MKECSSTMANQMGIRKTEKQKNARVNKIEAGEKKLTDVTTSI